MSVSRDLQLSLVTVDAWLLLSTEAIVSSLFQSCFHGYTLDLRNAILTIVYDAFVTADGVSSEESERDVNALTSRKDFRRGALASRADDEPSAGGSREAECCA